VYNPRDMKVQPLFPIQVFYDGSCSVCATEIEHYLRQDHGGKLLAIDIIKHTSAESTLFALSIMAVSNVCPGRTMFPSVVAGNA
jgi:predicted DCC family thiol-disulfide oxidoreductase YuxK